MLKKVASTDQFTPEEMAKIRALIGTAKKTTHIIQVLDESGSMNAGIDITLSSYNEMTDVARRAQLASGDETTATLITFADEAEVMYEQVPIGSVVALTKANYVPEGMTALYDAIGLAIHTASKFKTDENTAFLLQIFTDGGENVSKFYGAPRLKSMIEELNATGKWTVTVAGPQGNIDIFAQALSIPTGNVTGFDPGSLQSRSINASNMIASTAHYFSARAAGQSMVNDAYSAVELTPEIQSKINTSSVGSVGVIAEAQPDKDAQLSGDALTSAQ
jgi:hypothetical protein